MQIKHAYAIIHSADESKSFCLRIELLMQGLKISVPSPGSSLEAFTKVELPSACQGKEIYEALTTIDTAWSSTNNCYTFLMTLATILKANQEFRDTIASRLKLNVRDALDKATNALGYKLVDKDAKVTQKSQSA